MFDIFMIFVRIKSLIIRFAHDEISETVCSEDVFIIGT